MTEGYKNKVAAPGASRLHGGVVGNSVLDACSPDHNKVITPRVSVGLQRGPGLQTLSPAAVGCLSGGVERAAAQVIKLTAHCSAADPTAVFLLTTSFSHCGGGLLLSTAGKYVITSVERAVGKRVEALSNQPAVGVFTQTVALLTFLSATLNPTDLGRGFREIPKCCWVRVRVVPVEH